MADVKGLDELLASLNRLPERVEKKVLSYALREGAKVYQRQIRANVDGLNLSGDAKKTLKRSLIIKAFKAKQGGVIGASVRIRKPRRVLGKKEDAFFYHWIEYGTRLRYREARGKHTEGGYQYRGKQDGFTGHIEAQPFIRPAAQSAKSEAAKRVAEAAREKMVEALSK